MVGGTLDTYIAGSTTPATTWQDSELTIANTNPISLDARGECVLWLDSTKSYKFVLKNAAGVTQWTQDNIIGGGSLADRLRTDLSASSGASLVGFQQAGTGAVPTTVQSKLREIVSVKDFGAKGDGTTDDTAGVQAAINYAKALGGGRVVLPRGVYIVSSVTVYSNIWLVGEGRSISTIKMKAGVNADVIYGDNAYALFGTNSGGGIQNVGLFDLTVDGNRSNNLTGGSGIVMYGEEFYFQNLSVTNTREQGIRTEWYRGDSVFGMESHYINVRIDSTGKEGWWNNGPHDSVTTNLIIIDGSMDLSNGYDGLRVGKNMTGRFIACHVWNRAASNRHQWALRIEADGGGNDFIGCHFEGAWSGNAGIFCSNNTFDSTCWFYSAWNGVNIYLGTSATFNTIRGRLEAPGASRPDCVGVVLGGAAGDWVSENVIDVYANHQKSGAVSFTNSDGNNRVTVRGYQVGGVYRIGTPHTRDIVDMRLSDNGSPVNISNVIQSAVISVPAGGAATWTFPFPFAGLPHVTFSPEGPSGTLTSGMWISSRTATDVAIFNSNSVATNVDIIAVRT